MKVEVNVIEIESQDPEFGISERMLTMVIMKRLCISRDHRATLLTKMNSDYSTRSLIEAIKESFVGDVPHTKRATRRKVLGSDVVTSGDSAFSASPEQFMWHEDGGLAVFFGGEEMQYWPADQADEAAAMFAKQKPSGKGGKKGDRKGTRERHPAEGDGKHVKNARDLKC